MNDVEVVAGFSRIGHARLGSDKDAFEAYRNGNLKHTRDAIQTATARYEVYDALLEPHPMGWCRLDHSPSRPPNSSKPPRQPA